MRLSFGLRALIEQVEQRAEVHPTVTQNHERGHHYRCAICYRSCICNDGLTPLSFELPMWRRSSIARCYIPFSTGASPSAFTDGMLLGCS